MLEMYTVDKLGSNDLNINRRKTKKQQILLYDTGRRAEDFINKIKFRKNGNYNQIPHFIVTKLGTIYQLYDTNYYSNTFDEPEVDKQFIKIAIENLGWLNKNTITGFLSNWIGDPVRSEPFMGNWRNHYYWDTYSEPQIESLSKLCNFLCEKHNIPKKIVPNQVFMENVVKFKGVVCKSNFSNIYNDINPSFKFKEIFKNEQ